MMKKYIIIKGMPILFSPKIVHADVVGEAQGVESAGFFLILNKEEQKRKVICIGESTSLSITSRPEIDQQIIAEFLELEA